ncbi:MAG: hypothetical protein AAFV07_04380, partial [Bacteroidota bacterium]
MPALPPHMPDLDAIDPRLWHDPDFRKQYQAQLDKIAAVQEEDTFIAYATHRHLFEELDQLLMSAKKAFAEGYPRWQPVWESWQNRLQDVSGQIHPLRRTHIEEVLKKARLLLDADAFTEQTKAGALLEALEPFLDQAKSEFTGWEKDLQAWRQTLKGEMEQVWAEDYAPLKAAYVAAKESLDMADAMPVSPLAPDTQALDTARQRKQTDLASLAEIIPSQGPLHTEFEYIQAHYVPRTRFGELEKQVKSRRRKRMVRRLGVGMLIVVLGTLGLWWGPQQYQNWQAEQVWAQVTANPSVETYRTYILEHPGGRYARKADSLMRTLPAGKLESYTDPLGRTMEYDGKLSALVPDGKGAAVYADGSQYTGYFSEGLPDSSGVWTGGDSSRYEGEWQRGEKQGQGVFTAPYFGTYTGAWKADQPQGQGTRTWPDGGTYSGYWEKGARTGQGNWEHPDGSLYVGGWQDDAFHGIGSYTDSTGATYRGAWVGGLRAGKGQQSWPDGSQYQGDMRQDKRLGQGVLTRQGGGRFQGGWEADTILGWGTMETRYRSTLDGYWRGTEAQVTLQDGS